MTAEGKSTLNALIQGLNKFPKVPLSPQRGKRRQVSVPHSQICLIAR